MSSVSPLEQYKSLLVKYHEVIHRPGPSWVEDRMPLVEKMDRLWPRLSPEQREWLEKVFARDLHRARLGEA